MEGGCAGSLERSGLGSDFPVLQGKNKEIRRFHYKPTDNGSIAVSKYSALGSNSLSS